jgi:hypothetical protein
MRSLLFLFAFAFAFGLASCKTDPAPGPPPQPQSVERTPPLTLPAPGTRRLSQNVKPEDGGPQTCATDYDCVYVTDCCSAGSVCPDIGGVISRDRVVSFAAAHQCPTPEPDDCWTGGPGPLFTERPRCADGVCELAEPWAPRKRSSSDAGPPPKGLPPMPTYLCSPPRWFWDYPKKTQ